MNFAHFIYLQKVPVQDLQVLLEKVFSVSMIKSNLPDWFFYYEDTKIDVSFGLWQPLDQNYFISPCKQLIKLDMKIVIRAAFNHLVSTDVTAAKCVNAILNKFDVDLIFMFEDGTPRLVRCQNQVLIDWPDSPEIKNFWNRPQIKIIDNLTIPYKKTKLLVIDSE